MINTIVFSKDRACQLNLLLDSVREYYSDMLVNISIIYTGSNENYLAGYDVVKKLFYHNWIEETSIEAQLPQCMDTKYEYTVFLMDDSFFFRKGPSYQDIVYGFTWDTATFSLRLGHNTHPKQISAFSTVSTINWRQGNDSYLSYPLSLDGHVFKTRELCDWLKQIELKTPNIIESQLMLKCASQVKPNMATYHHSCLVTVPVNRVQDLFPNWYGLKYPASQEELNKKYLDGYKIDFKKLQGIDITCPHQEVPFEFVER